MAYQVGGNQGMAYTGQEGRGKAFILPEDDDSMLAYQNLLKQEEGKTIAANQERLAAKKEKAKTKAKLDDPKIDWWIAHDTEMQEVSDKVMQLGADLMAQGVDDPFSGTDEGSQLFKKELQRLKSMGKLSLQYRDIYAKDRDVVLNDKDGKYTDDSKAAWKAFWETGTLQERLENGDLPPGLMVNKPEFARAEHYGKIAKALGEKNDTPSGEDFKEVIGLALNDPAARGFQETLATDVINLEKNNPTAYADLKQEADANNISPQEMLGVKQLKSYFGTKPIDIIADIKDFLPKVNVTKWSNEDATNITRAGEVTKVTDTKLTNAAKAYLDFNPKSFDHLITQKVAKDKKEAIEYIKGVMKSQIKEGSESSLKREGEGAHGTGYSPEEFKKMYDEWWKAVSGGDWANAGNTAKDKFVRQNKAMSFLATSTDPQGRIIQAGRNISLNTPIDMAGLDKYGIGVLDAKFNYGDETDYNPDIINFKLLKPSKVEMTLEDGSVVEEDVYADDEAFFQFNDPTLDNYASYDNMMPYFINGLKKQRRAFAVDIDRNNDETEPGREDTKKELQGLKSKTKAQRTDPLEGSLNVNK